MPPNNRDAEVRKLTSLGTFKGAKAEVSKTITTNFVLRHAVQLGDSPANPNAQEHYSFMAQVAFGPLTAPPTPRR